MCVRRDSNLWPSEARQTPRLFYFAAFHCSPVIPSAFCKRSFTRPFTDLP
nr:MAG TPA: hypothetical protein [Caudoviricetes sp.]